MTKPMKISPKMIYSELEKADLSARQVARALGIPYAWLERALMTSRHRIEDPSPERMRAIRQYCKRYQWFKQKMRREYMNNG